VTFYFDQKAQAITLLHDTVQSGQMLVGTLAGKLDELERELVWDVAG